MISKPAPQNRTAAPHPAPTKRGCRPGRCLTGCLILVVLLALLLLGLGLTGYWAWTRQPEPWEAAAAQLHTTPKPQRDTLARNLENRLVTGWTSRRNQTDRPAQRVIRVEQAEANAWLDRRARRWVHSVGGNVPVQVNQVLVWTDDGQVVAGVESTVEGVTQILAITASLSVTPQGPLRIQIQSVQAGHVHLPVQTLIQTLGLNNTPGLTDAMPWIDQAFAGIDLDAVYPLDATRQVRVVDLQVLDDAVELTIRTEPLGTDDTTPQP